MPCTKQLKLFFREKENNIGKKLRLQKQEHCIRNKKVKLNIYFSYSKVF